jgi:hypothetical protein
VGRERKRERMKGITRESEHLAGHNMFAQSLAEGHQGIERRLAGIFRLDNLQQLLHGGQGVTLEIWWV